MAKRKRRKRAVQLWAARDARGEDVYLFAEKPRIKMEECNNCGGERLTYQGKLADENYSWCHQGFAMMTGVAVGDGEAIQLKVTRVEE